MIFVNSLSVQSVESLSSIRQKVSVNMKNNMKKILLILSIILLSSCSKSNNIEGAWIFNLELKKAELPFLLKIKKDSNHYSASLFNAEEIIEIKNVEYSESDKKVTIEIANHISLEGKLQNNQIIGHWIKHGRNPEYKVPFKATKTKQLSRFQVTSKQNIAKKWKVVFSPHDISKPPKEGLLLFKSFSPVVRASVLTKTGDYRYLEGQIKNNELTLYGFDGVFAFVFKGTINSKSSKELSLIKGIMHAGKDHSEPFAAQADANFELPDPEKITYVEPKDSLLKFKLKNSEGSFVNFSGKSSRATILQIFGSWCPNCIDETLFINTWLKENPTVAVDIYAIAFEREQNEKVALKTLKKLKSKLNMQYSLLLGAATKETTVKDLFPEIKQFISFPTTIYIDKTGKVRKIHTGFNGPATGYYFEEFSKNFDSFVKKLSSE